MDGVPRSGRNQHTNHQRRAGQQRGPAEQAVGLFRFCAAPVHALFHESQHKVQHQRQQRDQQAAGHGHRRVVGRDAAVDRNAQTARTDERGDAGQRNGHGHHAADTGQDHRHGQRQLDLKQDLHPGAAHALCGLQNGRGYVCHAGMRIAHHRQECIDGQGDDRRGVSHPGKRDEEAQHGDGRDGIQKIDERQRRFGGALKFGDQNAGRAADHDRDQDRSERDLQMLPQKPEEELPALGKERQHIMQHGHSPLLFIACAGHTSAHSPQCRQFACRMR